jgi:hypothetical protein
LDTGPSNKPKRHFSCSDSATKGKEGGGFDEVGKGKGEEEKKRRIGLQMIRSRNVLFSFNITRIVLE